MAKLTSLQLDALGESGNIAMGAAATTLSQILGEKVRITAPKLTYTTITEVRKNRPIPCVLVNVSYKVGLQGTNVFILSDQDAAKIANIMMGRSIDELPETLDELYLSAISEAMNQMMGSSATAMSEMYGRRIDITPPMLEYVDLKNPDAAVADFEESEEVIQVAFEFTVGTIISSTMLQLLPTDFAAALVEEMLDGLEAGENEAEEKRNAPGQETLLPPLEEEAPPVDKTAEETVPPVGEEAERVMPAAKMAPVLEKAAEETSDESIQIDWLRDVTVNVKGVLGRCRMTLAELMSVDAGSVVELDTKEDDDVDILANGKLVARGQIVLYNEQLGIKITEIVSPWPKYRNRNK